MPAFNPTGFTYRRSYSGTEPMTNGVETFTWNNTINGFRGDMLVSSLAGVQPQSTPVDNTYPLTIASGTVFPMPLLVEQPADFPTATAPDEGTYVFPYTALTVGVADSFKYTPLGANYPIVVQNFPANTPIAPNTVVEVRVNTDPFAVYNAQYYSPTGISPGVTSGGEGGAGQAGGEEEAVLARRQNQAERGR